MKQKSGSRWVRGVFAGLSWLFFISIIVQVFLAGIAIFADPGHWSWHQGFIHFFEFVPIAMLILSFFAGIPKRLRWLSGGLYLMIMLQYMTAHMIGSVPYLAALHPIIALALFWGAVVAVRQSMELMKDNQI